MEEVVGDLDKQTLLLAFEHTIESYIHQYREKFGVSSEKRMTASRILEFFDQSRLYDSYCSTVDELGRQRKYS